MELQRGKHRAFQEDEPVSLPVDLASKPSWQTILELKENRETSRKIWCIPSWKVGDP